MPIVKNLYVQWLILTLVFLSALIADAHRSSYLPDLLVVKCAGLAVLGEGNPYASLEGICDQKVLSYVYPPFVARISGMLLSLLGDQAWLILFQLLIASAFALLVIVAVNATPLENRQPSTLAAVLVLLLTVGGGILITAFRSGNIVILFWAGFAGAALWWRSVVGCLIAIVLGACVKIHLAYLLVVPMLLGGSLWGPIVGGGIILSAYASQAYFSPETFSSYIEAVRLVSKTPGYVGAGSLQLGGWLVKMTGIGALAALAAPILAGLLLALAKPLVLVAARERHLANHGHTIALALLTLFMMSPRMQHYDVVLLVPIAWILWQDTSMRRPLAIGLLVVPILLRCALLSTKLPSVSAWVHDVFDMNYDNAFALYVSLVWFSLFATTVVLLTRFSKSRVEEIQVLDTGTTLGR